ncbi:glutathione S-transferase family protein [Shimia abyssi]|uniref:Tetrachloro-p-hydroquinone reductive dehalogenase n=1 Tax=Shimia abyssi TaxID=1662395 RepID=A0A2P8F6Y7_9RHOB|nr:glutathione S-transferase family protein [Shimia abyssi]PSL17483.1 tetrachloro-p-hydroquinone reductive dehalogenase [Shimia abyssi]
MLKLYHGKTSVCSAKVRVGLAELNLPWDGTILDLGAGEQNEVWYLKLNHKGVVPTVVNGDVRVAESSVILEYLSDIEGSGALMPKDPASRAITRMYLSDCIDIHAAINTLTFATSKRQQILQKKTAEQISASIERMASPANALKRRDIIDNGTASSHVTIAFFVLTSLFQQMRHALSAGQWMQGETFGLADIALIAYVDRLDRLGLSSLWAEVPDISRWLADCRARESYKTAIEAYAGPADDDARAARADGNWDMIEDLWQDYQLGHNGSGK